MQSLSKEEAIHAEVQSALRSQEKRHGRWKQNREFTYNEGTATPAYDGAFTTFWPLTSQKVDALGATVVDTITSVPTFCWAKTFSQDSEDQIKLERTLQFFADLAYLRTALKSVSKPAAWANSGFITPIWSEKHVRFNFKVLEPDSTFVYPPHATRFEDAKFFGDIFYMRRSEVKLKYKKEVEASSTREEKDRHQMNSTAVSREDEDIKLVRGYRKEGEDWRYIVFAHDDKVIIKDEPAQDVEINGHAYAEFIYKPKNEVDGFYTADSCVGDIAELQITANEIWADWMNGQRFNIYSSFVTSGSGGLAKKIGFMGPGEIWEMETENLVPWNPRADLSTMAPALAAVSQQTDRVLRISSMAMGQDAVGVDTATEASFVAQGQRRSIDEYLQNFARGVEHIYKYMQYTLFVKWDEWFPKYGKMLGLEEADKEIFQRETIWQVAVGSTGGTPQSQMQQIMAFTQLAADPEYGYDKRQIAKLLVEVSERSGFVGAERVLAAEDPNKLIMDMAQAFGVDPITLSKYVAAAIQDENEADAGRMADLESGQMLNSLDGVPGGMAQGEAGLTSSLSPGQDRIAQNANQDA